MKKQVCNWHLPTGRQVQRTNSRSIRHAEFISASLGKTYKSGQETLKQVQGNVQTTTIRMSPTTDANEKASLYDIQKINLH